MAERRYFVDRRPDTGRWAVWYADENGKPVWVDDGWRDSADAEIQRLHLEQDDAARRERADGR